MNVRALAELEDGSLAAASADNALKIWVLEHLDPQRRWVTNPARPRKLSSQAAVLAVVALEDGLLAMGCYDCSIITALYFCD